MATTTTKKSKTMQVIEGFTDRPAYGRHNSKYPHDEWLDGQTRQLDPSEYGVTGETLRESLKHAATRRGGMIRTRVVVVSSTKELLQFRFVPNPQRASKPGRNAVSRKAVRPALAGPADWPACGYMG